jgi:hypothetical protein
MPSEPRVARLSLVMRSRTRRSRRITTSTMPRGASSTRRTVPTSTPPSRTGAPGFSPLTSDMSARIS